MFCPFFRSRTAGGGRHYAGGSSGIDWLLRRWLRDQILNVFDVPDVSDIFVFFVHTVAFLMFVCIFDDAEP